MGRQRATWLGTGTTTRPHHVSTREHIGRTCMCGENTPGCVRGTMMVVLGPCPGRPARPVPPGRTKSHLFERGHECGNQPNLIRGAHQNTRTLLYRSRSRPCTGTRRTHRDADAKATSIGILLEFADRAEGNPDSRHRRQARSGGKADLLSPFPKLGPARQQKSFN
jgi:hypothetical protein